MLIDTPVLREFQLALNLEHRLLICLSCRVAFAPEKIGPHSSHTHGKTIPMIEHQLLRQLFSYFRIRSDMPTFDKIITPIEGLSIHSGVVCSVCASIQPSSDQLRKHINTTHPGIPAATSDSVSVQRFWIGKRVRYFVVEHQKQRMELDAVDLAIEGLSHLSKPVVDKSHTTSTDVRNVCPWLRHARWQDLVAGKSITDVRQSVAYPSENEFPGLAQAVTSVFFKASEYIDKTPELILQLINSPDEHQ